MRDRRRDREDDAGDNDGRADPDHALLAVDLGCKADDPGPRYRESLFDGLLQPTWPHAQ